MSTTKKRTYSQEENDTPPTKKQLLDTKSTLTSLLSKSIEKAEGDEDFRIITGTYERILYGINCYWTETKTDKKRRSLTLAPIFIVPAHTGLIRTVGIGGHFLASGSTDEIIRLYDIKKRKEYGSLGGHHQGDITDIKFYGKFMLTASEDHSICLWRTKDWEYLKTLKGHKGRVNSLAIHPTGKIALSVSVDRTVIVWNLMTAKKASVNKLHGEGMKVLWNEKGDQYAIMFDRNLKVYNVSDAEVKQSMEHRSKFHDACYCTVDDKEYLISGHEDKTIRMWDVTTGDCISEIVKAHDYRVKTVAIVENEGTIVLVSTSSEGWIKCWDIKEMVASKGKDLQVLGQYNTKSRITCCAVHQGFAKSEDH
ncbi:WD40-repeat-containing domain protein [Halteromyces radiatus]|uniref:WD40-repeat-containing domain protein n=1 Tax=Halteromyces radiatus TaxID=101107 RepID=UPI002220CC4C|nr:WD40-repeat-containing domain protein [Halteromyces radiatus]KAI8081470.1 WD40-repeat-containing domain protein [Halteromyces radiatus]